MLPLSLSPRLRAACSQGHYRTLLLLRPLIIIYIVPRILIAGLFLRRMASPFLGSPFFSRSRSSFHSGSFFLLLHSHCIIPSFSTSQAHSLEPAMAAPFRSFPSSYRSFGGSKISAPIGGSLPWSRLRGLLSGALSIHMDIRVQLTTEEELLMANALAGSATDFGL